MQSERGQMGIFYILIFAAIALVVVTVTLLFGLSLVGNTMEGLGGQAGPINKTAEPDPVTNQAVEFEDTGGEAEITQVYSVRDSRGYAVKLTGADDSFVESDSDFTIAEDENWTVSTWASVNSSAANENMTALSANGRILIQYNGSRGNWSVWYYDDGSRNSYRVEVDAPNQPGNLSWIAAWHNGTHLTVYRNTTQGEIVNTSSGSSIEDANTNTTNWNGRLDETRTFDDALNSSERSERVNSPILPGVGNNRTARIMYDQGQGSSTPIYFTSTSATLSNASWVDGLDENDLTEGTDYELHTSNGTVTALNNGKIDGAPVVFISYEFKDVDDVVRTGRNMIGAYNLLSSAIILIPAVGVLAVLLGGLGLAVQQVRPTDSFEDPSR